MIPIEEEQLQYVDTTIFKRDRENIRYYKKLCTQELEWCQENSEVICNKANVLYKKYISNEPCFAGQTGFFQDKILPFLKDKGVVLIGIPGLKNGYTGRAEELLSDWLGGDAYMFKSPKLWEEIIGSHERIESVETWEMDCFSKAWNEWLTSNHEFARGDEQHFETIIKPYTCFVGIYIKLK